MNEVNVSSAVTKMVPQTASSKGAVDSKPATQAKPAAEAVKTQANDVKEAKSSAPSAADVQQAVTQINDYVQTLQRNLQFSVDEDLDQTVIKVVDGESGEVIRQIPEEFILELARKISEQGDFHLVNVQG